MSRLLKAVEFDTKMGAMVAIADDKGLYLLEFEDAPKTQKEVERLKQKFSYAIETGSSPILTLIKTEMSQYFEGTLKAFKTPLVMLGTPFQKSVWQALMSIPYGETCSYSDIAKTIGMPMAFRAVANANRSNTLSIIIPCHRVIKSDGSLCGYGGGVARKEWLIQHEQSRR